jgi:hypothetical protein
VLCDNGAVNAPSGDFFDSSYVVTLSVNAIDLNRPFARAAPVYLVRDGRRISYKSADRTPFRQRRAEDVDASSSNLLE